MKTRYGLACLALFLILGCSRGVLKGPEGQGEKGLGLKIPVLGLFDKETYDKDNFAPDNLDVDEINPVRPKDEIASESEAFSRYQEESDSL